MIIAPLLRAVAACSLLALLPAAQAAEPVRIASIGCFICPGARASFQRLRRWKYPVSSR